MDRPDEIGELQPVGEVEPFYPLTVYVCAECKLAQLQQYVSAAEICAEYAYFSAYSDSRVQHAKTYTEMIIERLDLGSESYVVELASNDGYRTSWLSSSRANPVPFSPLD